MTATATQNLAAVVHESEEAAAAAAAAQAKAEAAQLKAERARRRAEEEQSRALAAYLDKLQRAWPTAREQALTKVSEARAALEAAIRGDGTNVFQAYGQWVRALIDLWQLDAELSQARDFCGVHTRETVPPTFSFGVDIAAIFDAWSAELQDLALDEIRQRRIAFMSGRTE